MSHKLVLFCDNVGAKHIVSNPMQSYKACQDRSGKQEGVRGGFTPSANNWLLF